MCVNIKCALFIYVKNIRFNYIFVVVNVCCIMQVEIKKHYFSHTTCQSGSFTGACMSPASVNHILYKYKYVPRKGFRSAVCGTIYTIYLSLCTKPADPNPFRDTLYICISQLRIFHSREITTIYFFHSYRKGGGLPFISFSRCMPNPPLHVSCFDK